jgi:hypothetical protein
MGATVTIETPELTLRKSCNKAEMISAFDVVKAIAAVVHAYDAASDYSSYNVREHLLKELQEKQP